jgi:hypothetical protein
MLLYLFACEAGTLKVDDSGAVGDTDETTDTDTTVLDDTGGGGDDTGTVPEGDLTFDFDRDATGQTLTLTWFAAGEDAFVTGDVLVEATIEGDEATVAAAPPASDLAEVDAAQYPGLLAAFYLPAVADDDGYTGVGLEWPVYLAGDLPSDLERFGLELGWNVFVYSPEGDLELGDPDAIPVDLTLTMSDALAIGGTWAAAEDVSEAGLALLPDADAATSLVFDETIATGEPWEIALDGAPPQNHVQTSDGFSSATEVPLAYLDADGSGGASEGDEAIAYACDGADTVVVVWAEPVGALDLAFTLRSMGVHAGWNALAIPADGASPRPIDGATDLTLREACAVGP